MIYETMRRNRNELSNSFIHLRNRIDKYKNNFNKYKKNEKILEGGLTSNSKLKFSINSMNLFSKPNTLNLQNYLIILSLNDSYTKEIELSQENIHLKHKL